MEKRSSTETLYTVRESGATAHRWSLVHVPGIVPEPDRTGTEGPTDGKTPGGPVRTKAEPMRERKTHKSTNYVEATETLEND